MKIIKTNFFDSQISKLSQKYQKIYEDIKYFEKNIAMEPFSDLGNNIYKYRIKNSSIPVGKRGGFRIIVKIFGEKVLPVLIYSKTDKENIADKEIISALKKISKEL